MIRTLKRAVLPLGLAIVPLVATAGTAFADPATPVGFEIEAKTAYCTDNAATCIRPSDIGKLRFALAETWRFSPGRTYPGGKDHDSMSGTPEMAQAVCAEHYYDGSGNLHALSIHVFAFPGQIQGSSISGNAWVNGGAETDTHGLGHLDLWLDDGSGDTARIVGTQATNNQTDTRDSGGFKLTLSGLIVDSNFGTGTDTPVGQGTLTCDTKHAPTANPTDTPNYFEDEIGDSSDPNS